MYTLVLQDPVTGGCYNDIIMLDSRSWQWMALEVPLIFPSSAQQTETTEASKNNDECLKKDSQSWCPQWRCNFNTCVANHAHTVWEQADVHVHYLVCPVSSSTAGLQVSGVRPPARHSHITGLVQKNTLVMSATTSALCT